MRCVPPRWRDAPVTLPVAEDIPAGRTDVLPLPPGTVARIMTGAPVPEGADAIVAGRADRRRHRHRSRSAAATELGTHVRRAGGGRRGGRVAAHRGHGARARADRRRRGGRARDARGAPPPGACWSCPPARSWSRPASRCGRDRSTSRTGRCSPPPSRRRAGPRSSWRSSRTTSGVPRAARREAGRPASRSRSHLRRGERGCLRGGQGRARRERRRVRQGRDAARGAAGRRVAGRGGDVVVTLPGNPVSSLVSFEVFVRPALRAAMGHPEPARPVVVVRLASDWPHPRAVGSSAAASWTPDPGPSPRSALPPLT